MKYQGKITDPKDLVTKEYVDTGDDELKSALNSVENDIAIRVDGNKTTYASGAAIGQYVIVDGSSIAGITDGLYKAAKAIPYNTVIDSTYLTAVAGGGINDLKAAMEYKAGDSIVFTAQYPNTMAAYGMAMDSTNIFFHIPLKKRCVASSVTYTPHTLYIRIPGQNLLVTTATVTSAVLVNGGISIEVLATLSAAIPGTPINEMIYVGAQDGTITFS